MATRRSRGSPWPTSAPRPRARSAACSRIRRCSTTPECPAGTPAEASGLGGLRQAAEGRRGQVALRLRLQLALPERRRLQAVRPDLRLRQGRQLRVGADRARRRVAEGPPRAARRAGQALAFLLHFVGDLHQPLHAGDQADKGGNDVAAELWHLRARRGSTSIRSGTGRSPSARSPAAARWSAATPPPSARASAAGTVDRLEPRSWQVAHDVSMRARTGGDACAPSPARSGVDDATDRAAVPVARREMARRAPAREAARSGAGLTLPRAAARASPRRAPPASRRAAPAPRAAGIRSPH